MNILCHRSASSTFGIFIHSIWVPLVFPAWLPITESQYSLPKRDDRRVNHKILNNNLELLCFHQMLISPLHWHTPASDWTKRSSAVQIQHCQQSCREDEKGKRQEGAELKLTWGPVPVLVLGNSPQKSRNKVFLKPPTPPFCTMHIVTENLNGLRKDHRLSFLISAVTSVLAPNRQVRSQQVHQKLDEMHCLTSEETSSV